MAVPALSQPIAAAALAAATPTGRGLRVLEIGAGTGGATGALLDGLGPVPRAYTFTDLSPSFLAAARDRFREAAIDTPIPDIQPDPAPQGFAAAASAPVVATHILHATPHL